MSELEEMARTLYALPPAQFTQERNAAASAARDAEAAATIRAFRKPTASATAVNTLIRAEPSLMGELLDVGAGLRQSQDARDRDAIREFTVRRQQVIASARKRLSTAQPGLSASVVRDVEETLQAAMIDDAAAAAVGSGFLVRSLESTGLEAVDIADAVALPVEVPDSAVARPGAPVRPARASEQPKESAAERRARERRHSEAVKRAENALAELADNRRSLAEAENSRSTLESERADLEKRLAANDTEYARSRDRERELRRRQKELERDARTAQRELDSLS